MSAWLEQLQNTISNYPPWLVLAVFVLVLGVACILVGKVMRVFGIILAVLGIIAAGWFAWIYWTTPPERTYEPRTEPEYRPPADFQQEHEPATAPTPAPP